MNAVAEKIVEKVVEVKTEEMLANRFPAKFSEHLKVSFLFETKVHKYFRMDYYNASNDNHIDRSYFVAIDIKTNDVSVRN